MQSGGTPSTSVDEYWSGDIPWITGADFGEMNINQIRRYITEEAVVDSSTKVIPEGDILLVSRTGVGKIAIAPFDVAISQDITGLSVNNHRADTQFLLFSLYWTLPKLARFNPKWGLIPRSKRYCWRSVLRAILSGNGYSR
jgi:type I restriction enzyme S subunit